MKKLSGFTLLELMAVLAIAGALLALAAPAMKEFVQKSKMTSFGNEMVSSIQIARSEAIKRAGVSCVCSVSDATAAIPACDGGDTWETGWITFFDTTGDCDFEPAGPDFDVLLKAVDNNGFENYTVRNNNPSINNSDFIRFSSRGIPVLATGANQQGMFTVCDERGYVLDGYGDSVPRGIVLSAAGSVRTIKDAVQVTACP